MTFCHAQGAEAGTGTEAGAGFPGGAEVLMLAHGAEELPVGVEVLWGGIAKLPGGTEEFWGGVLGTC